MKIFKFLVFVILAPLVGQAAETKLSEPPDLSAPVVRHKVSCPPPGEALCMMRPATVAGFRVLSQGVLVETKGEWWFVSFSGVKPGSRKGSFQVAANDGAIHDIAVDFAFSQIVADKAKEKADEEARIKAQKDKEAAEKAKIAKAAEDAKNAKEK